MTNFEFRNEAEELEYDRQDAIGTKSADEIREGIIEAREDIVSRTPAHLGEVALERAVIAPNKAPRRRYSRRGGRSYPEPSDSSLDPYWNGTASQEQVK